MKFLFALIFFVPLWSALKLEHKSLSLNSNNRVCGLREFSKKPLDTIEYLPTILDGWKLRLRRIEGYISVGADNPKKYVEANHPLNEEKPIFYFTVAGRKLIGMTTADVKNFNAFLILKWIEIASDMPDCAEFKFEVTYGDQKHDLEKLIETSHDLEITDKLADAQIDFEDPYGEKSRNYPVSKYALASKSPYFKTMFTNGMRESLQGKDEPITIQCHKLNEKVQQDFLACLHQNKFTGQKDNECMSNYLMTMEIGHLVDLLELANACQVEFMVEKGENALLEKVKESMKLNDISLATEYAKIHDNVASTLLVELALLRASATLTMSENAVEERTKLLDKIKEKFRKLSPSK